MEIVRFLLLFQLVLLTSSWGRPINFRSTSKNIVHHDHDGHHDHHRTEHHYSHYHHHHRNFRRVRRHRPVRTANNASQCYFSVLRIDSLEKNERDKYSRVSTNCSSSLLRWEDLLKKKFFDQTMQGTIHEMDVVAARGGAEYVNWENETVANIVKNRKICSNHIDELLTGWKTTHRQNHMLRGFHHNQASFICTVPNTIPGHKTNSSYKAVQKLTKDEANAVLHSHGVHLHIGIPMCVEHKKQLKLLASVQTLQQHESFSTSPYCLRSADSHRLTCSPTDQNQFDDTTPAEKTGSSKPVLFPITDLQKLKLFEFVDLLQLRYARGRSEFSKLTRRSKMRRASALNTIIDAQCEALAPGDAIDLRNMAVNIDDDDWGKWSNDHYDDIMKTVAREYLMGETIMERRSILAIAASSIPYSAILHYIPNLTYYQYRQAKLYSNRMDRDRNVTSHIRIKFDKKELEEFVTFFTSELFRTDLPFGRRILKKTDGTKLDVPDVLRTMKHTEIIQLYIKVKMESGENVTLSVSSMYKILDACKATQRKSLTCLDYYVQEADDGFDEVKNVIDHLLKNQYIDGQYAKSLSNRFLETKQYFKGDYKLRLKNVSRVGDHCIQHSLSSEETQFSTQCAEGPEKHNHDMFCQRCEMAKETFKELIEVVTHNMEEAQKFKLKKTKKENEIEAEDLSEKLIVVREAISSIENLKRHTVRNVHIQRQRLNIIENMEEDEAFLTMDWAQKQMPKKFREPQSEYFGKAGMSVHVTNVLKIDKKKSPSHHNLIHIMKQDLQDSAAFLLIVEHSLTVLKKSGISSVHLRADNAVCYHSTGAIMSLVRISEKTGVHIKSFTYSEPQGGKGAADRAANDAKKKVRDYVNSGHDAETPDQLFEALTKGNVPKAMSTYLISVDPHSTNKTTLKIVPSITSFFDFWFLTDKVRMKKYGGIGTGELLTAANYQTISGSMTVLREGGFTTSSSEFWNKVNCQTTCPKDEVRETIDVEEGEETIADEPYNPDPNSASSVTGKHYFRCPEEHCERKFLTHSNLQRHVQLGKHSYQPEKEGLIDSATSFYKQRLEHWDRSSRTFFPLMEEEILNSSKTVLVVKKGWALPEKRSCIRHSNEAKSFVKEIFEKLREQRTKPDFKAIANQMKTALKDDGKTKRFAVSERLNHKQIKSMYIMFGRNIASFTASKKGSSANTGQTTYTTTPKSSSKKRKNEDKDVQQQKKKSNGRPKRSNEDLTTEEMDTVWSEVLRQFDDIACHFEEILDSFEFEDDIVDDVVEEILKKRNEIYL